nr:uncharacterized protein LOC128697039 [Cherax quadricarinatus]
MGAIINKPGTARNSMTEDEPGAESASGSASGSPTSSSLVALATQAFLELGAPSFIHVNLDAVVNNINVLKSLSGPNTDITWQMCTKAGFSIRYYGRGEGRSIRFRSDEGGRCSSSGGCPGASCSHRG